MSDIFEEVATIIEGMFLTHAKQEKIIREWSCIDSDNYQSPLVVAVNSLQRSRSVVIDATPWRQILVDIVNKSAVGELLRFNEETRCVEDRPDASESLREKVRDFILSKTKGGIE